MESKAKRFLVLLLITIIPTLLIWLPFFFRLKGVLGIPLTQNGMATIVSNYDGPLFLVVAKSFYATDLIKLNFSFPLPTIYYTAHFPLFPLFIRLFSLILGYPYALLGVTVLSSFIAIFYFYKLARNYVNENNAIWLSFIFAIFPARWLIVRSVGSAEPLFMATIIASFYFFNQKKYLISALFAVLAQLTKSPGLLLFISYALFMVIPNLSKAATMPFVKWINSLQIKNYLGYLLVPISLLGLFYFFKVTTGDFFAYFHSGDNIHLFFPPFQIFNYSQPWVGTFWTEEVIFVYLFGILGFLQLIKEKAGVITWFVGIFFLSTLFVSHRDIIRYSLPIVPFLIIAFRDVLIKKEFKIALIFLLIPIYLFSMGYISQNVMPISDWSPFL